MPATTPTFAHARAQRECEQIAPGWRRVVLAGGRAYPGEVVSVGEHVVRVSYILDDATVALMDVYRNPAAFAATFPEEASQSITEQCHIGNCHGRRDIGDGARCYQHRQVRIGLATVLEDLDGVTQNDQRDIPHLDSRTWHIPVGTTAPVVAAAMHTRTGLLAGTVYGKPHCGFSLGGRVVADRNYAALAVPLAQGPSALSGSDNQRVGERYSHTISLPATLFARTLRDREGKFCAGAVGVQLDPAWEATDDGISRR